MTAGSSDVATPQSEPLPRPEVRLVAGRLSDAELAAVAVSLAAINAASRAEAHERRLADAVAGTAGDADGWSDAGLRLPGSHEHRRMPGAAAWQFSHR